MKSRLLYLVGGPGAGKSTVMRRATNGLERVPLDGKPARDALLDPFGGVQAIELGARRGEFSGTDALPMNINPAACSYVARRPETGLLLGEGARLANRRFLTAAVDAGWDVMLLHLDNPLADEWRARRAARVGAVQDESWARGRATAARNLAENPPRGVTVVTATTPEDALAALGRLVGLYERSNDVRQQQ